MTVINTFAAYIEQLPEDRRVVIQKIRESFCSNLPPGFEEQMSYGMPAFVVPHTLYPGGYHCNPKLPLPFISYASQKNFIALYHMGLYADPELMKWFYEEFEKTTGKKPDAGKSCIRFKKPESIPIDLIGSLASKLTPSEWISIYERELKR